MDLESAFLLHDDQDEAHNIDQLLATKVSDSSGFFKAELLERLGSCEYNKNVLWIRLERLCGVLFM